MERKIGRSSSRARAKASSPHAYQSTGLPACSCRYGLEAPARRLPMLHCKRRSGNEVIAEPVEDLRPATEAVPGFRAGRAVDAAAQWAVVFARELHHPNRHAHLSQGAVHLERLAQRI